MEPTVCMTESASRYLNQDFVWQRIIQFDLFQFEVRVDGFQYKGFGLESHLDCMDCLLDEKERRRCTARLSVLRGRGRAGAPL